MPTSFVEGQVRRPVHTPYACNSSVPVLLHTLAPTGTYAGTRSCSCAGASLLTTCTLLPDGSCRPAEGAAGLACMLTSVRARKWLQPNFASCKCVLTCMTWIMCWPHELSTIQSSVKSLKKHDMHNSSVLHTYIGSNTRGYVCTQ